MNKRIFTAVFSVALSVLAIILWLKVETPVAAGKIEGAPVIGGNFTLKDDQGRTVTEKSLVGITYHLIFFGYTSCPDVCPGMLMTMAGIYEKLPPATQKKLKMVFISVDPDRDTLAKLHSYVTGFNPTFTGWTGTPAQIEHMTKSYLATAVRTPAGKGGTEYNINHSSFLYLMGPDGIYITHLRNSDSATSIRETLERLVE